MGIVKCLKCNHYIDEEEAAFVEVDDNHEAAYCVNCAPDEQFLDDDTYDPDEEYYHDETE